MSEEFDPIAEPIFSSFWPLLIVISTLVVWYAVQDYELNAQASALNRQVAQAAPQIAEAQNVIVRYRSLMTDLLKTAEKDEPAKAIIQDSIKAGLIQVKPGGTNSPAATPPK